MNLPKHIRITEVGPRDGLQNESLAISADAKIAFIDLLSHTGVAEIEVSSFVSPKWVPQLGDAAEVFNRIQRREGVIYSALVPNERGLDAALALPAPPDKIAVFTAASETFSQKNTNATIAQTLQRFQPVIEKWKTSKPQNVETSKQATRRSQSHFDVSIFRRFDVSIRAYISCAVACPYEGPIDPKKVRDLAAKLLDLGVDEIDLGDTIGVAAPTDIEKLYDALDGLLAPEQTTLHLHDTRGTALACAYRAAQLGVASFDSSCGGIGGCPFAPGAMGNIATEELVYTFNKMGCDTGVNLKSLFAAGRHITSALNRQLPGRLFRADGLRT
jgi:hydroxymethylglutaryl-CoA lyase